MLLDRVLGHGLLQLLVLFLAQVVLASKVVAQLRRELELVWAQEADKLLGKYPVVERSHSSLGLHT